MASNSFGELFRITTFGESHGPAIGVVIDGCPAGLPLDSEEIDRWLKKRAPGRNRYTSPRSEEDRAQIYSGLFEGKTTGAPLAILIANRDADSTSYEPVKELLRPGHANFTYLEKYGVFDWRGGGRASARETAARVAAGAVARKLLDGMGISLLAYLKGAGPVSSALEVSHAAEHREAVESSPLFCPDSRAEKEMKRALEAAKEAGDSLGGVVEFIAEGCPAGLGDPLYDKLEARLAYAMMGLPAAKGFEIGSGFSAANMRGSEHNDSFICSEEGIRTSTNRAGGILGGISTGSQIVGRVAFKPTSSIQKEQKSVDLSGEEASFRLPAGSRHDPCVAIRAVPVVEAMLALVLADAALMQRACRRL